MTFRSRVLIACVVVAIAPLIALTLGIRHEVDRRLTAEYQTRVQGLVAVIREDLARRSQEVDGRLAALTTSVEEDAPVRAAMRLGEEHTDVLDWAGRAMPLAGLDYLMVVDSSGRILSSGQFRNEYGRRAEALTDLLRRAQGPVLVRARTAEGSFLALARGRSFAMGTSQFLMAGGVTVDRRFLDRLARAEDPGDLSMAMILPGEATPGEVRGTLNDAMTAELALPYLDDTQAAPVLDTARLVVRHSLAPLAALQRRMNLWFGGGLVAALVLAVAIAQWISGRVIRPLTDLTARTRRLNLDRLDVDFRSSRLDEVGSLTRVMAAMVERLRTSVAQLRQAERRATVGDMARQVNHDIRNGLLPIRNVVRHLGEVAGESPEALAPVFLERQSTLEGGIAYLEGLSTTYARLSPRPDRPPTDVNEVARTVVRDAAVPARATLTADLANRLPQVAVDPIVLRRIVENLVVNALESLDDGGSVAVSTAVAQGPDGRMVAVTVTDNGRGMDPERAQRVFEDFFTTKPEGTGLGLSIVRRLVADLGGRVDVESEPGKGSRFRVELPALETGGS